MRVFWGTLAAIAMVMSVPASATRYDIVSRINKIRYHTNQQTLSSATWQGRTWIAIETPGAASASTCNTVGGKITLDVEPGNESAIAIALSAKAMNAEVTFTFDDSLVAANGSCLLQYITW